VHLLLLHLLLMLMLVVLLEVLALALVREAAELGRVKPSSLLLLLLSVALFNMLVPII
jgi:hypothetical protein